MLGAWIDATQLNLCLHCVRDALLLLSQTAMAFQALGLLMIHQGTVIT